MKKEALAAAAFISRFLVEAVGMDKSDEMHNVDHFNTCLIILMMRKYDGHWYLENSQRGEGFRCIQIEKSVPMMDQLLVEALHMAGLSCPVDKWPQELYVWVNPGEVTCQVIHSGDGLKDRVRLTIYPTPPTSYKGYSALSFPTDLSFPPNLRFPPPRISIPPPRIAIPPPLISIPPPRISVPPPCKDVSLLSANAKILEFFVPFHYGINYPPSSCCLTNG